DGTTSSETNPTHAYAAGGTYDVRLEVTDDAGATDAVTRSITVTEPSGGEFVDPSSLDGLVLWLKADGLTGLADGDPVGTWPDASGAGADAVQATASRQPVYRTSRLNGLPALAFDAENDGMSTPVDPPTETTVFVVYASRAAASGYALNGGFAFFMGPYVGRYRNYTGGYASGPSVEAGRWVIHVLRQSSSLDELWLDGALEATTTSTADPGRIRLADAGTYGQPLDGEIAEVIVYGRTLDDAEMAEVTEWLGAKYGVP
ncbi:MAG: PKD domain-containing protein, partial [Gemmatimonadota bacterium]|nr:PKD domain-containing protein [Gemmatimonadota bacterium]